jgi:ferrous iron transport protein B
MILLQEEFMGEKKTTIALAGNPNSGKTTIFNNLTGSRQHVGNYPGVTVEKKEGYRRFKEQDLLIVDLPGTYSLTAYSPEEVVARNFVVQEKPDVVVDIIDASNLERNLYLATQLLELETPMVLALNMADVAESWGIKINDALLEERLGVSVVRTVGNRSKGMEGLLETAVAATTIQRNNPLMVNYGTDIESAIQTLEPLLAAAHQELKFPKRWLALKLLENDADIRERVKNISGVEAINAATEARATLQKKLGEDPELLIAELRYRFVGAVYRDIVVAKNQEAVTVSDKVDKILTNRALGLPIFLGLMWLVFNFVFTAGAPFQEWIEAGVEWLGNWVGGNMAEGDLKSLIVDGVIGGVGGVIVFLPNILLLFFAIALLEGTGYMARAAFIMDRIMHKVGLHGKSFIPLLLGFGCSLPAIMGTRTLENPRDRLVTILVAPLMSCAARLPVYTVLIAAFFSESAAGNVLFSIYLLGIVLAVVMARIFRTILFPGATEPFVMELPPYRIPTLKSILIHMWERSVLYVQKAGTIILAVSIIIWFLTSYPSEVEYSNNYEALAAQAEIAFVAQTGEEIAKPLHIENLEEDIAFQGVVAQIAAVDEEFAATAEEIEEGSSEQTALKTEKEAKLKELAAANPDLYGPAARYVTLKDELDETKDKLEKEQAGEKLGQSYAGRVGKVIEPVLTPLGFDWKIGVSLFAAFTAKEVLVSTLGTIYSVGEADETSTPLKEALVMDPVFNPLVAYALMVFVLIYSPCLATIAVIKRETNSWKWALFSSAYSTVLAWFVAFIIYQGGKMIGLG